MDRLLDDFPEVNAAFGYGSGIFAQPLADAGRSSSSVSQPMLDFIFAVRSPVAWHEQNIRMNRKHYSFLSALGANAVTGVADGIGAGVHFNALVPWRGQLIKYGVVQTEALCRDLRHWHQLYIAGRLQKPVLHLARHAGVDAGVAANLDAALGLSLLLLPQRFSTQQLLETICGLSYTADVRMAFAEDTNKVRNIVHGSRDAFEWLYSDRLQGPLASAAGLSQMQPQQWAQCSGAVSRTALLSSLPMGVLSLLANQTRHPVSLIGSASRQEFAQRLALTPGYQQQLRRSIGHIVRTSSRRQALAGMLAAGAWRSLQYGSAKLAKAWRSR